MATLQRQQQSQHIKSQPMNQQATQQAAHLQSNGQPQRMPLTNLLNDLWEWKGDIEGTIRSDELDKYDLEVSTLYFSINFVEPIICHQRKTRNMQIIKSWA